MSGGPLRALAGLMQALLLTLVLVAGLWLAANSDRGRHWLAGWITELSGGTVIVQDLGGSLPFAPRIGRLMLRDNAGIWLTLEDAVLSLEPAALLHGELAIDSLQVRSLVLARRPAAGSGGGAGIRLPIGVRLQALAIAAVDVSPVVPDAPLLRLVGSLTASRTGVLDLTATLDAPGRGDRYHLRFQRGADTQQVVLRVDEDAGGLLALLAASEGLRLPAELGVWRLDAEASGPREALSVDAALAAGPYRATATGVIDALSWSATGLRLSLDLPSLALSRSDLPDIGWRRLAATAALDGPLLTPRGSGQLELDGLAVSGWRLDTLTASLQGDLSGLALEATVLGISAPVPLPDTALIVPLRVEGHLTLDDPALPLRLSARHPLLAITGDLGLQARIGEVSVRVPDIAVLAAIAGLEQIPDLAGSAHFDIEGGLDPTPRLDASGEVDFAGQSETAAGLLGESPRFALSLHRDQGYWRLGDARLEGAAIRAQASSTADGQPGLDWRLTLPDLGAAVPPWTGNLELQGQLTGPPGAQELVAELAARAAHPIAGSGRISGRALVRLAERDGSVKLGGDWAGQPISVGLTGVRSAAGDLDLTLGDGRWAGVSASGDLRLAARAALPVGEVVLQVERLADLNAVIASLRGATRPLALEGRLDARVSSAESGRITIDAQGVGLALPGGVSIQDLELQAALTAGSDAVETRATARAHGLAAGGIGGDATLTAAGSAAALDLAANGDLSTPAGPLVLAADGRLDAGARQLRLQGLTAVALGETLRLLAPATLDLDGGIAVDQLRLGLSEAGGSATLAGRLRPTLDLDATVDRVPLALLQVAFPALQVDGMLDAALRLTGPLDDPIGDLRANVGELRVTAGPARGLPPARLELQARRAAGSTDVDAGIDVGPSTRLRVRGQIAGGRPRTAGRFNLRAEGRVDLAVLDALLIAEGRQASGILVLDGRISGQPDAPRLEGRLRIEDAALYDRNLALALTSIDGAVDLAGDTLRVERLSGRSGGGSVSVTGSVGLLAEDLPVDLRLVARDAEPVQLDRLQVRGDAELSLRGRLPVAMTLAGGIQLHRVDIRLPDRLPPTIVTLEVRERGATRRPRPAASVRAADAVAIDLDLAVTAPRAVHVRGRGIDAELGGSLRARGPAQRPEIDGGFTLLRGEYELLGQRFRFTSGRIDFDGSAGLDPRLDLETRVTAAGSTAILAVRGRATAPRIELSGEPELPADEVLSRLLFGVAGGRLTAWQVAQVGRAAATLAGVGGEGPGLLRRARDRLGLENLWIGSGERGSATLEGGRYIADGLYIGARQGTHAGDAQGVLRMDLTPRIRLETDIGAARGARTGAAFELEY